MTAFSPISSVYRPKKKTIAEELDRIAREIESLDVLTVGPGELFRQCCIAAVLESDGVDRYTFRDGSVIIDGLEDWGVGYPAPASCFCLVADGHTCGTVDLPAVDPAVEAHYEEEAEIWRNEE